MATPDTLDDDGESVKLTFGTLPTDPVVVTPGSTNETVISIADDDGAGLVIDTTALTVDEDGSAIFSVKLATQPTGNVTVSVTSSDTSAATVSPASRTFNTSDWNMDQTFTVSGVDDTDAQDETLTVSLSASGADYARVTGSVTVNVTDDDPPTSLTVSFGAPTYTVAEGGSATVTVTLSDDPEQTVTIPITRMDQDGHTFNTSNWASSDDYSGVPPNVVFNSGDTAKTFTFMATPDTLDDDGESVKLTFGTLPTDPVVVTPGSTNETVISIADDDGAGLVIDTTALTVDEDGSAIFSVKLATQPTGNVTVSVTSSDTSAATVSPASRTFNTSNWNMDQTFTVSGVDDTDAQDETLTVSLTASGADYARVTGSVTVNVTDDDTPSPGLVINPSSLPVDEAGTAMFSVRLATQPTGNVTVSVTSSDTGAATVAPPSRTFKDSTWNMDQTFTVTGVNDADADSETLTVSLTAAGADYAGVTGSVTVNLTDDDTPRDDRPTSLTVNFGAATYSVDESDDPATTDVDESQVVVTVTLSEDPGQTVKIPLVTENQDGASSDDYSGVPDNVVFNSGETEKTFTFTATNDTEDDDGESVNISFGGLSTAAVPIAAGSPAETVISITDDDRPTSLTVNFGAATYSVNESDDPATTNVAENQVVVTVTLSEDPEQTVTIPITRMDQDGASSDDYSGVPLNVVFNSGDTAKTFTFTAHGRYRGR